MCACIYLIRDYYVHQNYYFTLVIFCSLGNLKLVKVFDESKKGKSSFLLLVNKTDRSKDDNKLTIRDQATFPPHEMEYLKLIVDDIMENPLREVKETR